MESTNSEFENLDTPDSFFSAPDKLTNIISRAIINIKNSESDHPPRAKKNYKNPCSLCHKQVRENQKGIQCNNCDNWVHAKCNGTTTDKEYQQLRLEADDVPWSCISCIIKQRAEIFPFGFLSKLELCDLNGVDLPSFLRTLPSYDTQSKLSKMPNLGDFDIDENFVQSINSKYLNVRDLSELSINKTDLTLFHINLRSLTAHFDELHTLLGNLKIPFDFIGITETKQYKDNDFLTDVTIQNYNMYCQSSSSHAGGVALYVKSSLD